MSVVPAIGSWLLAVWVMLAPRTAKLSGGLAETPGRQFHAESISEFEVFGVDALSKIL